MDRATAIIYMQQEYEQIATDAKFSAQQVSDAYNFACDMALRQLGTQETDLVTATVDQPNVLKFLALLNYYLLKRYVRVYSTRFDVAVGNGALNARRSQAYQQLQELLKDATEELLKLGIDLGGGPSFQIGRINLDFNEPGYFGEFDSQYWGF